MSIQGLARVKMKEEGTLKRLDGLEKRDIILQVMEGEKVSYSATLEEIPAMVKPFLEQFADILPPS